MDGLKMTPEAEAALLQAMQDAAFFSMGYVVFYQDGRVERLDPRGIFLEPPEQNKNEP